MHSYDKIQVQCSRWSQRVFCMQYPKDVGGIKKKNVTGTQFTFLCHLIKPDRLSGTYPVSTFLIFGRHLVPDTYQVPGTYWVYSWYLVPHKYQISTMCQVHTSNYLLLIRQILTSTWHVPDTYPQVSTCYYVYQVPDFYHVQEKKWLEYTLCQYQLGPWYIAVLCIASG